MRLPLHTVHPIASGPRALSLTYLQTTLDAPLFARTEVLDVIDLPCGYDLTVSDGFYLVVVFYVALRMGTRAVAAWARDRRRLPPSDVGGATTALRKSDIIFSRSLCLIEKKMTSRSKHPHSQAPMSVNSYNAAIGRSGIGIGLQASRLSPGGFFVPGTIVTPACSNMDDCAARSTTPPVRVRPRCCYLLLHALTALAAAATTVSSLAVSLGAGMSILFATAAISYAATSYSLFAYVDNDALHLKLSSLSGALQSVPLSLLLQAQHGASTATASEALIMTVMQTLAMWFVFLHTLYPNQRTALRVLAALSLATMVSVTLLAPPPTTAMSTTLLLALTLTSLLSLAVVSRVADRLLDGVCAAWCLGLMASTGGLAIGSAT